MRYLFGDSTPFALTFDFLATLEAFVACAGDVVRLDGESKAQEKRVHEEADARARSVEGLERFHQTVLRAMRDSSMKSLDRELLDYATAVSDHATRYVEDVRRSAVSKTEREVAQLAIDVQRRREESRHAVERFFLTATLPVLDAHVSMRMHGLGKDAYHEVRLTETHPLGLISALELDAGAVNEWRHPRRVAEFASGIELKVGAKRSWFNKTVQRDTVRLDELYVTAFELDDDAAEVCLRKKLEQKDDSLVFSLKRADGGFYAEARHPDDAEVDQVLPATVEPEDRAHLERLWQILRVAARDLYPHRRRVSSLHLDMVDVFEADKLVELVDRLVTMLSPTANEIARRSPNQHELSLKEEGEDGRRREIYLRKEDLVRRLEGVPAADRQRFAPLSILPDETAVPSPRPVPKRDA